MAKKDETEEEEEEKKSLTPQQKIFCENYVLEWNGAKSYRIAYPDVNDDTAKSNACRLLTYANVKEYVEEIQKDLAKLCGVSAARNINELKKIAYTNLANFKSGWMTEKNFDELTDDEKAALSEIQHTTTKTEFTTTKIVKFKVHDKQRAIEIMNKMLGFNSPEKVDHTTKGDKIGNITDEELNERINKLNKA